MEDRKVKGNITFTKPDMRENSAEVEPKEDMTQMRLIFKVHGEFVPSFLVEITRLLV